MGEPILALAKMHENQNGLLAPRMDVQRWKADPVTLRPKDHGHLMADSLNSGCRL